MSESVIFCEGYHDRAFWAGWLKHLGCSDPGAAAPGQKKRNPIRDPWKTPVTGGHYAYLSKSGRFVRVIPCQGKSEILPDARARLNLRGARPVPYLVIAVDPDVSASGASTGATGLRQQDVLHFLQNQIDSAAALNSDGEVEIDGGKTKVALVRWEVADLPAPGLPDQQTLERLACSALVAAYPTRAKVVQDWLDSHPEPPAAGPKEYAWSYMAGWYADQGCEAFYSCLWTDTPVVAQLESRLRASGAWRIAEALAL
jgi:hypothetical protein